MTVQAHEAESLLVAKQPRPDDQLHAHRWLLLEEDEARHVTVAPAMTQAEVQLIFPQSVVQLDARLPDSPEPLDIESATAWGLLLGERDPGQLEPYASVEGLAWLRDCGMREFLATPERVIATLSDAEAVQVATAMVDQVALPAPLAPVLAVLVPPMRGPYGKEAHRAKHARSVLRVVAADAGVRAHHLAGGAR